MRGGLILALMLLCACAKSGQLEQPLDDTWSVDDKDDVRLDLVALMVDQKAYAQALANISMLRREGMSGDRIDVLQARALLGEGQPEEALLVLNNQRSRDPEYYRVLGLTYLDLRRFEEAVVANQQGLRFADRDQQLGLRADLYNNLGFALVSVGRIDEGIEAYQAALRLDSELYRSRNNLGFALAAQGRDEEALDAFMRGQSPPIAAAQRDANAWYNLGLAQLNRGDKPKACASFEHALAAVPHHPQAQPAQITTCQIPLMEAP